MRAVRIPIVDDHRRTEATRLTTQVCALHEAGRVCGQQIQALSSVTGQSLTHADVDAAFGSMSAADRAQDLLLLSADLPSDLGDDELVQMVAQVCAADASVWLENWMLRCVEHATGCDVLVDIIYHPRDVFGDEAHDNLTPAQIVAEAKKRRRRVLLTPPPDSE
jgi:hypothetical protein